MSKLTEMLRRHEGEVKNSAGRHIVYDCPAGHATIGIGRNVSESGLGLSDIEVEFMLEEDIARCAKELGGAFNWFSDLNEARRDAIIDLVFNIGLTRLNGFKKALAAMADANYDLAAAEFMDSKWASQVKDRAIEICAMIKTGKYLK
jgi:lysozyme